MTTTTYTNGNGRTTTAPSPTNGTEAQVRDLQIEAEVSEIRAIYEQMEVLEAEIAAKKARLRSLLTARGEQWQDDSGYARLVSDSVRTSYNAKELDALMLRSPWWFKRLSKFRREFSVKGTVQVK